MLKDHCGIFATIGENSVKYTYEGLKLLQHRGQDSAGISYIDNGIKTEKGLGLVEDALRDDIVEIRSMYSIGHVRYSTTGKVTLDEAQPLSNSKISIAFNGTITNYYEFGEFKTDTEFILNFLYKEIENGADIVSAIKHFIDIADGGYSMLVMDDQNRIIAVRDPKGFRPLTLGKIGKNIVFSSEDSAIKQLGGNVIKDVRPGEIILVNPDGSIYSERVPTNGTYTCSFEYIYFSRADSKIDGISVYLSRIKLGEILAKNHPAKGDVVVPVPDSSRPIAIGFSRTSGIPLEEGLIRTIVSKRSFIMPSNDKRKSVLEEKFGIVDDIIKGKRIILIDDSIVRGNTMRRLIKLLRQDGAAEIHIRIGSPMIRYPCYMGIDFPSRKELLANDKNEEEIARYLGADSVEYLTVDEMKNAIGRQDLCVACFSGIYPLKGKYNYEQLEKIFKRE
ncbi:amidophosphoribosyltransferase [Acidianus sulfidivorans JP7]|uniref:Amidophosphoribosyltransferase n=1 Tax=Acidianus sulfidivorans JP7 TaxID=619593 RepID=A0A2U9INH7_9CREN|nr:amidophosphoribosyltransferase [Acidianus sulfidivorans]AWR97557.1 amidophosphoribosyltransferase [Acidianus sulfidivorans JP7]